LTQSRNPLPVAPIGPEIEKYRLAALSENTRALISNLSSSGLPPAQILTILRKADPNIALTPKDIANLTYRERLEELNGKTPIQWLLEELTNNRFRPKYHPESGHLERLAYIHPVLSWLEHSY
jgi:hypothetical protein